MVFRVRWHGVSGWPYDYDVHPFNTDLPNVPGNYILCGTDPQGYAVPLYVGEAESLGDRCKTTHEKWRAAIRLGVTHIHVKATYGGKLVRCAEESDLRNAWNPPLNDQ